MARSARLATAFQTSDDPESWVASIRCELESGAVRKAWRLATEGAARFPGHEELDRLSRLLAPPVVTRGSGNVPDMSKAFQWLKENASKFRGQWVALSPEGLIAASPDYDELLRIVRSLDQSASPLVHFVD